MLISIVSYGKNENFIEKYNNYERAKLELELKEKERAITSLKKDAEIQDSYLELLYKDAEYRNYIENIKLDREFKRAKIYYYNQRNNRRYY